MLGLAMGRVWSGSCRVDEKNSNKELMSRQPIYETGQKIINATCPIYKRFDCL